MSQQDLFDELSARLDPPNGQAPKALRQRVLANFSALSDPRPRRLASWFRPRKLVMVGGLAAAATILALQVVPVGETPPAASAAAVEVLSKAAAAAQEQPVLSAQPDQFVFIEFRSWDPVAAARAGEPVSRMVLNRSWHSVDGSRDGLIWTDQPGPDGRTEHQIGGCSDGRAPVWSEDGLLVHETTRPCEPEPAYLKDLPTDTKDMRDWLYAVGAADGAGSRDQQAFASVGPLMMKGYLTPSVRAAVFEAVTLIPGVSVAAEGVADAEGRDGIAVTRTEGGLRQELIFDQQTYEFLGWQMHDVNSGTPSEQLHPYALLRVAIVDHVKQVP